MVSVFFFLIGLCVGSFLNVVAYRIPKNQSIVKPGSFCPECKKPIKPYNNIPLLSYALLKGRCPDCGSRISLKYPAVELTAALLFVVSYLVFGLTIKLAGALVFVSLLIAITVIDFELQIIPDKLILFGMEIGIVLWVATVVSKFAGGKVSAIPLVKVAPLLNSSVWWSWVGLFGGALAILTIAIVSGWFYKAETMGGGDVKLAALVGFFIGPYVFLAIGLSFCIGALIMLPLLLSGKVKRKEHIPFGPFIALASIIVLFYGPAIWNWYWNLL